MNKNLFFFVALAGVGFGVVASSARADDGYVEPGSLRLSNEMTLGSVSHRVSSGWGVKNNDLTKTFTKDPNANHPWKTEWEENLLTEVATRLTPDIFGRVLFEAQGDYADRFWRPVNIEHHIDNVDRNVFLRQAEVSVDRDEWYAHGFSGVGHTGWAAQGDFFNLYPAAFPDDDYLGLSGYFGVYPQNFKQDYFLNISRRHVPSGFEAGGDFFGLNGAVAVGQELSFGYKGGGYGRLTIPMASTRLTFVYKNEDVPSSFDENERGRAYALSLSAPSEQGSKLEAGVLYQPFRVGDSYQVARDVGAGNGLLGSSTEISQRTVKKEDGLAARLRYERHNLFLNHDILWSFDLTHAGLVAGRLESVWPVDSMSSIYSTGNRQQVDLRLGTDLIRTLHGSIFYSYRRPLEKAIPLLYEGTANNMGAIAASPRGPESPFLVNWENREAVFLLTTFVFDQTPGTAFFRYNPETLQSWNISSNENAPIAVAVQHRFSDYRGGTDRQTYFNADGEIVFEPAGFTGAWATNKPVNEFRVLLHGIKQRWNWTAGVAGGQTLAGSGLAYTDPPKPTLKPISNYYSFEGRLSHGPAAVWGHYGSGLWGPEPYQAFFGLSIDRLWGLGVSYNITRQTKIDVSYMAARQGSFYVSPDVGSFDEIRMLFSHRFGFIFQFANSERPGYRAR